MGFKLDFNWSFPRHATPLLTDWHGDAVSFGVQQTPNLRQRALSLGNILQRGGFHEERVQALSLAHPLHALVVALGKHGRAGGLHGSPHPLVRGEIGLLKDR